MEQLINEYQEVFHDLPLLPKMVSYALIADLMKDAIVSGVPVSQDDIEARLKEMDEPVDVVGEE